MIFWYKRLHRIRIEGIDKSMDSSLKLVCVNVCVVSSEAHSDAWHLAASARGWAPTEGDEVPQPQSFELVSSECLGKGFPGFHIFVFFGKHDRNDFFRAGAHVIWNGGFCPQRCGLAQEESWAAPSAGHYLRDRLDETWSHCFMGTWYIRIYVYIQAHHAYTSYTSYLLHICIFVKYQPLYHFKWRYWTTPQRNRRQWRKFRDQPSSFGTTVPTMWHTGSWQKRQRLGKFADLQPGAWGSTISMLLDIFSSTPSEPSAEGQVQVWHCPKPRRNVGFRIWLNIQVKNSRSENSSICYDFKVRHACVVFFVSMLPSAVCVYSQWCACSQACAKAKI